MNRFVAGAGVFFVTGLLQVCSMFVTGIEVLSVTGLLSEQVC